MVIRKPYAFLIKNFKKIHIALLIFSLYIYYKVLRTNGFVAEFVSLGSYDVNIDPISNYITLLLLLIIVISFIGNLSLILLLKHKGKPWKLYLVPAIVYGVLFFVLIWAKSFFNFYDGTTTGMDIRLIRDVIAISMVAQLPIVVIYSMRILGIDLQKFNFNMDEEYLEMDKEDREELEINFNIDYHMFIRFFNKAKRYITYFYLEHKKICNTIAIIIAVLLLRRIILFVFVTNKSYHQGDVYNANGYTIVINNSYYTDKDKNGDIIEKDKAFVIVDLSIKNNVQERKLNLNNFHVIKGIDNYSQSSTTHGSEFDDLGKTVDSIQTIKRDETINTLLIYKVNKDKKVKTNKYVLFYQEINGGNSTHLRKIKLKINDLSKIIDEKNLVLKQKLPIKTQKYDDDAVFEKAELKDSIVYTKNDSKFGDSAMIDTELRAKDGYKILEIEFTSNELDGKDLIDFSTSYGKIKYDSKKINKIESAVDRKYYGKYLYIYVPNTVKDTEQIEFIYTIRNKRYTYKLSGGE